MKLSLEPQASFAPSGLMLKTPCGEASSACSRRPVSASQKRTTPSSALEAILLPSGLKATQVIQFLEPAAPLTETRQRGCPVVMSHRQMVRSYDAEASV